MPMPPTPPRKFVALAPYRGDLYALTDRGELFMINIEDKQVRVFNLFEIREEEQKTRKR